MVATMRSPETATDLAQMERVLCLRLDVTEPDSIQQAIHTVLEQFSSLDVVVNNAGYGLIGVFEGCTLEQIRRQFETNVFGLMAVTQAVLPQMRQQRSGVIVNVASIAGRLAMPFYSPYHATKWAVEGFSDSLQYELAPFNIRVKLIEPGMIKTDFYQRSMEIGKHPAYESLLAKILTFVETADKDGVSPEVTAQVIYRAATDGSSRLRYPAGGKAGLLLWLRHLLPDAIFSYLIRLVFLR